MKPFDKELGALFNRLADGIATEADEERLGHVLRSDPESRRAYREFMSLHAGLHWDYVAAATQREQPAQAPVRRRAGRVASFFAGVAAATATAIAVALFWPGASRDRRDFGASVPAVNSDAIAALLVDKVDAEFAPHRGPDGVRFGPGEYELRQGLVHLRFAHGADMILAGPAQIRVTNAQHVRLLAGKVRVIAPSTAKGFTVSTKAADYIDLGTEFGLRVDPNGASDLFVFDGQVNVADPRSGKVLAEVFEGKSSRHVDGVGGSAPKWEAVDFPTPGAIGLKRWERYEREMRSAKGLIAFFPFRREGDGSALVNALGETRVPHGKIVGARWVSGRWPGHGALLFDRDADHVQLEIPGEHPELTIASWLKVDRLDFELNAIFNSDGYEPGGVHFQLTRQGYPRGGVIVPGPFQDRVVGGAAPLETWVHVASVISAGTRTQQIFVNGLLARERHWRDDEAIKPRACRLGNWLPDAKANLANRAFRGRIDELAIWNRTLTQAEIARLVESGRPNLGSYAASIQGPPKGNVPAANATSACNASERMRFHAAGILGQSFGCSAPDREQACGPDAGQHCVSSPGNRSGADLCVRFGHLPTVPHRTSRYDSRSGRQTRTKREYPSC